MFSHLVDGKLRGVDTIPYLPDIHPTDQLTDKLCDNHNSYLEYIYDLMLYSVVCIEYIINCFHSRLYNRGIGSITEPILFSRNCTYSN